MNKLKKKIKKRTRKLRRNNKMIKVKTKKYINKVVKKTPLNKKYKSRKHKKTIKTGKKQKGGILFLSSTEDDIRNTYNNFMGENEVSSNSIDFDIQSPMYIN